MAGARQVAFALSLVLLALGGSYALAAGGGDGDRFVRLLLLQDYNTRVVVLGTSLLGLAAGVLGSFMLLRKRALLGDAVSHATLPGIAIAFMWMVAAGGSGKSLPGLLLGATISGLVGMGTVMLIKSQTRLKEDAALGIVLSVFFGLGVALLGMIQKMSTGSAAGLESFIYGKTASMLASDAWLIGGAALVIGLISLSFFKEFKLLCFDAPFAASLGWPTRTLDGFMMSLVVCVTVIGLQAVGLILVMALLVIPPAAARFWTENLSSMITVSALIGAISAGLGAAFSAWWANLPAGGVIVVTAAVVFLFSMLFGTSRGVVRRWIEHVRLGHRIARQHLLRALFEVSEEQGEMRGAVSVASLMKERSWTHARLLRELASATREGLVAADGDRYRLTASGWDDARRLVRNHRLWEIYLITHAAIAPSHVDRDADELEHVLGKSMVQSLEAILDRDAKTGMPSSPHPIGAPIP